MKKITKAKNIVRKPLIKKTNKKSTVKRTVKKIVKKTPTVKTIKKVIKKTTQKSTAKKSSLKKTVKSNFGKKGIKTKDNLRESLQLLHKEMERSLKRIEEMMKEVQHKEHHPKIRNAIKRFHIKQKKNIEHIRKKV